MVETQPGDPVTPDESESPALTPGRALLKSWLNKHVKMKLSDGRSVVGNFLCTDKDCNVILGSCTEHKEAGGPSTAWDSEESKGEKEEPRVLGLAMVPGKHIVSIHVDDVVAKAVQEREIS